MVHNFRVSEGRRQQSPTGESQSGYEVIP